MDTALPSVFDSPNFSKGRSSTEATYYCFQDDTNGNFCVIPNENLHLRKGDGTGKTQGERLERNSPVFPRSRLLHNHLISRIPHLTWGRTKGSDALFGGERSFPSPLYCWAQSLSLTWWRSSTEGLLRSRAPFLPISSTPKCSHRSTHHTTFVVGEGEDKWMTQPVRDYDLGFLISRNDNTLLTTEVLEPYFLGLNASSSES